MEIDFARVGMLLLVIEQAVGHGTQYQPLITAAHAELAEINQEAYDAQIEAAKAEAEANAAEVEPQATNLESSDDNTEAEDDDTPNTRRA